MDKVFVLGLATLLVLGGCASVPSADAPAVESPTGVEGETTQPGRTGDGPPGTDRGTDGGPATTGTRVDGAGTAPGNAAAEAAVLADAQVAAYRWAYPAAEVALNPVSAERMQARAEAVQAQCGEDVPIRAAHRFSVAAPETGHRLVGFVDPRIPEVTCVRRILRADVPAARPLGTVSEVGRSLCPAGSPPGAECVVVEVTCPDLDPLRARLRVAGTGEAGTAVLFTGGRGKAYYTAGEPGLNGDPNAPARILDTLRGWDVRTVEVNWRGSGVWYDDSMPTSIELACRSATVIDWIHSAHHTGGTFIGQGNSGGAAQIAYSLAHYGAETHFDVVNIGSPVRCPKMTNARRAYGAVNQSHCLELGETDLFSERADFTFPDTAVNLFVGELEANPGVVRTADDLHAAITTETTFTVVPGAEHGLHLTAAGADRLLAATAEALHTEPL